ncbi:MAG: hypothetical protein JNM66_24120 [Bryobacterales bacterium]|nr:hypothetical protein [Bryobacterales bacterium]
MPRSKRVALTPDTIDHARKTLASLPPPVPTSHTIRQAVDQLKSEISNLRDQGYTLAQIADHLNSAGIPVADSTLRNYASQTRRKRGKNTPRADVRKAPSPRKAAAAAPATSPPQSLSAVPPATLSQKSQSLDIEPKPKRGSTFTVKPDRAKI